VAEPLKLFFDRALVARIAAGFVRAWPGFPRQAFLRRAGAGLDGLELMARARHIAEALAAALPADRRRALQLLIDALDPEPHAAGQGMAGFFYLPHLMVVASEGLPHFELAMRAQHALTQRFTAELSIRVFLEHHPGRTLARLRRWARDPSRHVRRLVSEGTRPRLPWAPRLRRFERDPGPVLALLELLKDDPEPYVQRSVANNLNDIGKDHPGLLVAVCRRWLRDATPARRKIVAHALRSRVKAGDARALSLLGFRPGAASAWSVAGVVEPAQVAIGGRARLTLTVANRSARAASAAVDFAVHFIKAGGQARAKVFKGGNVTLAPGQTAEIRRSISFAVHTTRRPNPGRHRIDALVSGRVVPVGAVTVVA
jgi:3-methyladenine DNA glycosylase AlkC